MALAFLWVAAPPHAHAADRATEPVVQLFRAIVGIRARIPQTAPSAQGLGADRSGTGVVIGADGLVLTVGYLILDAETVNVLIPGGEPVPADVVGYDHETGFGLVRARKALNSPPATLGNSDTLAKGSPALIASIGDKPLGAAYVMSRRAYAGGWEYLLENAIYAAPAHPNFGGAALIGPEGQLLGIGSLLVNVSEIGQPPLPGNIFIPINLLKPILPDLVRSGRAVGRTNPWLGVYTSKQDGRVFVQRLAPQGPGERAGLKPGDVIIGVGGKRVGDTEGFLRQTWAAGRAGDGIPLDVLRPARGTLEIERIMVQSVSRYDWQRRPQQR